VTLTFGILVQLETMSVKCGGQGDRKINVTKVVSVTLSEGFLVLIEVKGCCDLYVLHKVLFR